MVPVKTLAPALDEPAAESAHAGGPGIHEIIDHRLVRTAFQPLIDLVTGDVVGFEALSRGSAGSPLERPDAMLLAAAAVGRAGELDRVFRTVALETAITCTPWPRGLSLFLNAEPATLDIPSLDGLSVAREYGIDVVVELTEREVANDIATLLAAAERIRAGGSRVALDDFGAEPASLALIPLLRPDVVKLDMGLLRNYAAGPVADTANAIRAYAEESGASVVAEGIESDQDLDTARVLGATVGQGWLFGRPGSLTLGDRRVGSLPPPLPSAVAPAHSTPFEVVAAERTTTQGTKALLLPISRTLEQRGLAMALPPMVLAAFQDARHFTPHTVTRYQDLAARLPFVAALGVGMTATPAMGVRGAALAAADPIAGEWTVIVLGSHFAAALVARDLGDSGNEMDRRFNFVVTHDRRLVVAAARTMVDRVVPV